MSRKRRPRFIDDFPPSYLLIKRRAKLNKKRIYIKNPDQEPATFIGKIRINGQKRKMNDELS